MANAAQNLGTQLSSFAYGTGSPLMEDLQGYVQNQRNKTYTQGDEVQQYYERLIREGGYSPEQAAQIIGQGRSGGVPGLDELGGVGADEAASNFLTPDEQASNFLSDGEQAGIAGNPNDPLGYLHSDTIGQYMQEGGEAQDRAVAGEQAGLKAAIDPNKLRLSGRYGGDVNSALNTTTGKLDAATGNPDLDLSDDFAQNAINSASKDVSDVSEAKLEDVERRNQAAGIGPMGMAASRLRYGREAASDAAAAALKARLGAETTRLGAAQNKAGLQTQAGEFEGSTALDALHNTEAMRIAAEQGLTGDQLLAAEESGRQELQNAQNKTQTNIGAVENVRNAEVAAHTNAEKAAADRAALLGTNRQTTSQGIGLNRQTTQKENSNQNYQRGAAANNALSQRYGQVAGTGLQQQNLGGSGLLNEQQVTSGNTNTGQGQHLQAFGTTGQLAGTGAQIVSGAQNQPGMGERILGAGLGAAGGILSAAASFEDGGVVTRPTSAVLGESGPEMVVPLSGAGGSQDSRPIGGTDAPGRDPFDSPKESSMNPFSRPGIGPAGMRSRYGAPPPPEAAPNPTSASMSPMRPAGGGFGRNMPPSPRPMPSPAQRPAPVGGQGPMGMFNRIAPGPGVASPGGAISPRPIMQQRYGAEAPPAIGPQEQSAPGMIPPPATLPGQGPSPGPGPAIKPMPTMQGPPAAPPPAMPPDLGEQEAMMGPASPPPPPPDRRTGTPMNRGGIVTHPTRAIIGDQGPEAVIPLRPRGTANLRMRPSSLMSHRYGT